MDIEIRPAQPDDAESAAPLMYSSGPFIFDHLFTHGRKNCLDFIRRVFRDGRGFFGHRIHLVAVSGERVVGILSCYSGVEYKDLARETSLQVIDFFGPFTALRVLRRSRLADVLMPPPARDTAYIADFGVAPETRSKGIGTALLQRELERARIMGKKTFALDVDANNTRGLDLYRHFGFTVVSRQQVYVRSLGCEAATLRMELWI